MKIQRTKNTVRNILFGWANKIITTVMPFVTRTIILYFLGADYLGLGSLFSSILSFLSLAELGFSNAMVYSMYKPIAENDGGTICALLNLYKKFYRLIGIIIFVLGMSLFPFLSHLIKGNVPSDINIYLLYIIYLANTLVSYFMFAYRGSLLTAHQRNDIGSMISSGIVILQYALQVLALVLFHSYYAYAICLPLATILTNIARLIAAKKLYPQYKAKGSVSKELSSSITKKVKALIGAKLNTVVLHASDNIVMSAFLGLTAIAVYNNYYYIMSAVSGFITICYSSMLAGLGNSIVSESIEKNYKDFEKFSFINAWLVGWCSVCLLCLYQPFMRIWMQNDETLMFSFAIVIQLVVYFYLYLIRKIPVTYKDAAGIWWEDRFRPYVCMIINVVSNIILVRILGISGIVLSTILSLAISIPWENKTIFENVFKRSSGQYYKKMLLYALETAVIGVITYSLCSFIEGGIFAFIVKMGICVLIPNALWVLLNRKTAEFCEAVTLFGNILHISKLRKLGEKLSK